MSYTVLNSTLMSGLLGDPEIAEQFSPDAEITAMLRFESALAQAEAAAGVISKASARQIIAVCEVFDPDRQQLAFAAERDGMLVPDLIQQLRAAVGGVASADVHFGSTSQDVIDTSLILRLKKVNALLNQRLASICTELQHLEDRFGHGKMMARTRMQSAFHIPIAHRLSQWSAPIYNLADGFEEVKAKLHMVQFGGPVGTLGTFGTNAQNLRQRLAAVLELGDPRRAWHTDRTRLVHYCFWLSQLATALGKLGLDILLMAQDERNEIMLDKTGGSSTMAHKKNPVKAEALLSLSRYISSLQAEMQRAALHEQERSGSAWTLEWMILPQLCIATGSATRLAEKLIISVQAVGAR